MGLFSAVTGRRRRPQLPAKDPRFSYLPKAANDGPRPTPPPPTSITLPCTPKLTNDYEMKKPEMLEQYFRLKDYRSVSEKHFQLIGMTSNSDIPVESLVPRLEYIPPLKWSQGPAAVDGTDEMSTAPPSTQTLSNGAAVPGHEVFFIRAKELQYDSEDAFRFVTRRPAQSGGQLVKIVHFRNFWLALEKAAGYWDTSKDNVSHDTGSSKPTTADGVKNQSTTGSTSARLDAQLTSAASSSRSPQVASSRPSQTPHTAHSASHASRPSPAAVAAANAATGSSALKYTGRRHDTGSAMPFSMREDLVKSFLEPILFCFGCRLERPTRAPKFNLVRTKLDADHSGRVYRLPEDRARNRAMEVDGPLMALHCNSEVRFDRGNLNLAFNLKELCVLLSIAQERNREGRAEKEFKDSLWWALSPERETIQRKAIGEPLSTSAPINEKAERVKAKQRDQARKPPSSTWEKRVTYLRVGKPKATEMDAVFLISCVAHHVSLVRLDVHRDKMDYLEGAPGNVSEARFGGLHPKDWGFKMGRSKRFDLLLPEDRVEALGVFWGALAYQMRDTEAEEEGCGSAMSSDW